MVLYNNFVSLIVCLFCASNVEPTTWRKFRRPQRSNNTYATHYDNTNKLALLKSEQSCIDIFNEIKDEMPELYENFTRAYKSCHYAEDIELPEPSKRKPFIVIEGVSEQRKRTITKLIADSMGAKYLRIPPTCMIDVSVPKDNQRLKDAFYTLCTYAVAFNVRQLVSQGSPVILNSYWYSHAAHVITNVYQRVREMPFMGDELYDPPVNLTMPDVVFYLSYGEFMKNAHYTTPFPGFLPRKLYIFKKFNKPRVQEISEANSNEVMVKVHTTLEILLGESFNLSHSFPYIGSFLDHGPKVISNFSLPLYNNIQDIIDMFEKTRESQAWLVERLISSFEDCKRTYNKLDINPNIPKKPFIVVEGNIRRHKEMIARLLARNLNAQYMSMPPRCMMHMLPLFEKRTILRNAYYSLCLYASQYHVQQMVAQGKAVVMNGYWTEQTSFLIKFKYGILGKLLEEENIYKQPEDLLKPDMLIHVYSPYRVTPETEHNITQHMEMEKKIYEKFTEPKTTFIDGGKYGVYKTALELEKKVKEELQGMF